MIESAFEADVAIAYVGVKLDEPSSWQPTRGLCRLALSGAPPFTFRELILLHGREPNVVKRAADLQRRLREEDLGGAVRTQALEFEDPFDPETVGRALLTWAQGLPRDLHYLINVTTGTPVIQWYLQQLHRNWFIPSRVVLLANPKDEGLPAGRRGEQDHVLYRFLHDLDDLDRRTPPGARALWTLAFADPAQQQQAKFFREVAARGDDPILLEGETGSGKTAFAREIHAAKREAGRRSGEFVELNAAGLDGDTARSELFGHERGAFTGTTGRHLGFLEQAHRGVLLLDEIGELPRDVQGKLLKALEEKAFYRVGGSARVMSDFHLVAATLRDLDAEVGGGRFREDLYERISLWRYRIPPLRERPKDMPRLVDAILKGLGARFSDDARGWFLAFATAPHPYAWPGNLRELDASCRRMLGHAAVESGGVINKRIARVESDERLEAWARRRRDPASTPRSRLDDQGRASDDATISTHVDPSVLNRNTGTTIGYPIERVKLAEVLRVCEGAATPAAAARALWGGAANPAAQLANYLARWGLSFERVHSRATDP